MVYKGDSRMNVALIPVRGGSKSIPKKNIKELNGKPLVFWTAKAANECKYIDVVYIATDDALIRKKAELLNLSKVKVINRDPHNATDEASTESVMLEFAKKYDFDNIALIQATSPLLKAEDLNKGFEKYEDKNIDSVISVVEQKRFIWEKTQNGLVVPVNYVLENRPRRQDFEGYMVENGAFYITSKERLLKTRLRISGNIAPVLMGEETYWEIDEPSDFEIITIFMRLNVGDE